MPPDTQILPDKPPGLVLAHIQPATHRYFIHYPEHGPRDGDPAYADFHAYKRNRRTADTWYCDFAHEHRNGDFSECDAISPLEAHHRHIEFAMMNSVDMALLEPAYPGVSAMGVGKWVESATNLMLLCVFHHRGHGGVHVVSASDYEGASFIRDLFT